MRKRIGLGSTFGLLCVLVLPARADEWSWKRIAFEGKALGSVVCQRDSTNIVYVTLPEDPNPPEERGVYKSTDGGFAWHFLPGSDSIPDPGILSANPRDFRELYCGSSLWFAERTTDAGQSWELIPALLVRIVASPWEDSLLFATGHALGGWNLQRSSDDGETWTAISSHEGPGMSDKIIFHRDDSLLVFAGMYAWGLDPQWGLARSEDAGFTWSIVLEGRRITSFDQDPTDGRHWAAIRADIDLSTAYFAESFDNGDTWDLLELPYDIHYVRDMEFDLHDSQTIYFINPIAGYDYLGIYRSSDGGHTLEPMNEGLPEPPGYISIYQFPNRPGEMLAATSDGLWWWTNQADAPRAEGISSRTIQLKLAGPCPFAGSVRGTLTMPTRGNVRAAVYSLHGGCVATLRDETLDSGIWDLFWDGRDDIGRRTPPGSYVLIAKTGSRLVAKRLIKLE